MAELNDMKKPTAAEKKLADATAEYEKCLTQQPHCPKGIRHGTPKGRAKLMKYNKRHEAWLERKKKLRAKMLRAQKAAGKDG